MAKRKNSDTSLVSIEVSPEELAILKAEFSLHKQFGNDSGFFLDLSHSDDGDIDCVCSALGLKYGDLLDSVVRIELAAQPQHRSIANNLDLSIRRRFQYKSLKLRVLQIEPDNT